MKDRLRDIDSKKYVEYSFNLTSREEDLVKQFSEWLPEKIVDCHSHCGLPEHVQEIDEQMYNQMISTFKGFDLEESYKAGKIFFPDKNIIRLRFPFPFRGIDLKASNDYLINNVKSPDKVALCGIPTDIEYTNEMLRSGKFSALKMYHQQFNPPSKNISEYFPDKILEVAELQNIPIILHLPKMITLCKNELLDVIHNFPNLKISLAHVGLPHLPIPNLDETYKEVSKYPNVYMDTAMIPSKEVLEMALDNFGHNRIMFGSDEPIGLVRSVVYNNPNLGQRIVTEYMYHWVNKEEHEKYKHLAVGATHMLWPALQAIKDTIQTLYTPDQQQEVKNDIFNRNAAKFFDFE